MNICMKEFWGKSFLENIFLNFKISFFVFLALISFKYRSYENKIVSLNRELIAYFEFR